MLNEQTVQCACTAIYGSGIMSQAVSIATSPSPRPYELHDRGNLQFVNFDHRPNDVTLSIY